MKSVRDINVRHKRVLLRSALDVPFDAEGRCQDTFKIDRSLKTIEYLIAEGARVAIISKQGSQQDTSLEPTVRILSEKLDRNIGFVSECVGEKAVSAIQALQPGEVIVLENVRFCKGEKENDPHLAQRIAALGDVYVQDAFAHAHRNHASIASVPHYIPTVSGFLMEREVQALSAVLSTPQHPVAVVIGGVKMESKGGVIKHFLEIADQIVLGGEIANIVLREKGLSLSKPVIEKKENIEFDITHPAIHLPVDVIAATDDTERATTRESGPGAVGPDEFVLDIGKETIQVFGDILSKASTIVWAGPMGFFERSPFERGTRELAQAMAANRDAFTVAGGGDTVSALKKFGVRDTFDFVSTGGGAMLDFLAGKKLPGLLALESTPDA